MPASKKRPLSYSDIAKASGVHRSTVTRAAAPGGPLAPAVIDRGRLDGGHLTLKTWFAERGLDVAASVAAGEPRSLPPALRVGARLLDIAELAEIKGVSQAQARRELAATLVPASHVTSEELAEALGVEVDAVLREARPGGLLEGAITASGLIDLNLLPDGEAA